MTHLRFSVIIPCYNDGNKLEKAVNSCLQQTHPPFEIIIIDDGSQSFTRDITRDLLDKHAQRNIRAFFLEKNQGVSAARNKGLDMAKGDYIVFLDADDIWHVEKLSIFNKVLDGHNAPVALCHEASYVAEEFSKVTVDRTKLSYKKIIFFHLLFTNPILTSSLGVPNEINLRFREEMRYTEDHEFALRLSKKIEIILIKEKLEYRDRLRGAEGGLSSHKWEMRKGELKMYLYLCQEQPLFYILLPIFSIHSMLKHTIRLIMSKIHFITSPKQKK